MPGQRLIAWAATAVMMVGLVSPGCRPGENHDDDTPVQRGEGGLSACVAPDEADALFLALLTTLDAASGLALLTGWFAAVPGWAPGIVAGVDEAAEQLAEDFAFFRRNTEDPPARLEAFWTTLTRAVNVTDYGVYRLRESLPWDPEFDRPPDPRALWSASARWKDAAPALLEACFVD